MEILDCWPGTKIYKLLVLDTSAIVSISKKEKQADVILKKLLEDGWGIFCPTPVFLEIGMGSNDKINPDEEKFWKDLLSDRGQAANIINTQFPTGFDLTPIAIQMWIQMKKDPSLFSGKIHLMNIDTNNWLATKKAILELANRNQGQAKEKVVLSKYFLDALILAAARNIFCAVWTDNPKDFLLINKYFNEVLPKEGGGTKPKLVPVFLTEDFANFINGKVLRFPSDALKSKIKDLTILKLLDEV